MSHCGFQIDYQDSLKSALTVEEDQFGLDRRKDWTRLGIIPIRVTGRFLSTDQQYRMTDQRQVILEEVTKDPGHPTADEIYERVRKRMPRISMGTVYRNLDILASNGLISRIQPGLPQMRFDGKTRDHYHLTCIRCGKIEDAPIEPLNQTLENLENALGHLTKYGIFGHKLEFVGLCKICMAREKQLPDDERLFQDDKVEEM